MIAARSVTCPACGGSIAVKAAGYSVTVACQYCGSVLDVANPDVKLIEEFHLAAMTLAIPLGTRGTLQGIEWEAIGYLGRTDGDESWDEYLLFNPYAGYRWLTCADGEWQFGNALMDAPDGDRQAVTWRGRRYEADYEPGTATTERVVGEFYWRVRAGDTVQAMTYSGGSETLSVEWSADETNWTALIDLPGEVVRAAFGVQPAAAFAGSGSAGATDLAAAMAELRARTSGMSGVTAALGGGGPELWRMAKLALGTCVAILVVMIVFGFGTGSTHTRFQVPVDGPERSQTVGSLAVNRPYQFVTVTARTSDFTNRWVDLDYSLVNKQTQQAIEASGTVEYYKGRDSDGDWTEGSHVTTTKFAGVPRGNYDIVVDASAHRWSDGSSYTPTSSFSSSSNPWSSSGSSSSGSWSGGETIDVDIDAKAGGVLWSNFIALVVALFGGPGLVAWLRSKG
jgi:hypothetical protein